MAAIKLTTGLKVYDIEDERGNIRGQISINPNDINFLTRAKDMQNKIHSWVGEVDSLKNSKDENEFADAIRKYDAMIKEEVNILFDDENTSSVVFGNQNVFNTLNGVTFVERFLKAIMPVIQKEFQAEQKKSQDRIKKYTKQVH